MTGWKAKPAELRTALWSPDGRYLAYVGGPRGASFDLYLTDTTTWEDTYLGTVARVDGRYEWEFSRNLLVWLSLQPATWGGAVPMGYYQPELRAFYLPRRAKHLALWAEPTTAIQEGDVVKVQMHLTAETTPDIEEAPLYKKYADKYFTCAKVATP